MATDFRFIYRGGLSPQIKIKGIVSLYKGRVLLFYLKSTAKRDEFGRHARASASGIAISIRDHAVSRAHSQLSIDQSQRAYDGR